MNLQGADGCKEEPMRNIKFDLPTLHKTLVEHISDVLCLLDKDGVIHFVSPTVTTLSGYKPHDVTGRRFFDYVHPEDVNIAKRALTEVVNTPDSHHATELRFRRLDGTYIPVEAVARSHLSNQDVGGIVVSARDISERIQARSERRTREFQIERRLQDTVAAVAATIDARDPYTAGHQRRVADISTRIAKELELPEIQVRGITLSATIHDLGKIKIPAEILSTTRRLTPLEYELIKTHAQAGAEILKDIDFPWPIAEIIWQHHEQFDGTGYPRGLEGEQILLEARIIAVADTVEAMASSRPYRKGLGLDAGLEEIEKKRGTSYCPIAVDACLRLFRKKGYKLPT
jgi:PAS domain S-box-containing protein/putative nucleotidyltransferase with HDIG domain